MSAVVNATSNIANSVLLDRNFSWFEQKWEDYYKWMDNDILATGVILLVVHELIYFGRSLPFMVLDTIPSMRKYKIQDNKPPTRAQYMECLKEVLLAHIFIEAVPIFGFHFVCDFFNISYHAPFPSWWTMAWQLTALFFMEDTWHYFGHRLLHSKALYKRFHKQHHKYAAPFGLTAEYAHPVEVAFTGTGTVGSPLLLAFCGANMHLITVMAWISGRLMQAVDSHSGYEFPWSLHHFLPIWAGADHHDDHHHYFVGNYASSFRHWDFLLGTETPAFSRRRDDGGSAQSKRHEEVNDPYADAKATAKATANASAAAPSTSATARSVKA